MLKSQHNKIHAMYDGALVTDSWGRLVYVDGEGVRHEGVDPVRAFPLSDPERWIAIVNGAGRELVMIEHLSSIGAESQAILRDELARREFVPVVTRVVRIKGEVPACQWTVETDRGRAEFTLTEEDHVRKLGASGVLITDARGVRYRIPELSRLDAASRRMLEPFV